MTLDICILLLSKLEADQCQKQCLAASLGLSGERGEKVERKWSSPPIGKTKLLVFVLTLTPHDSTGLTQLHLYPMAMTAWWRRFPDIVRLFHESWFSAAGVSYESVFVHRGVGGGGQIGEID